MAKTASQIQAERLAIKNARDAIHQKQMAEVGPQSAAKTAAVLEAAGHKTVTNPETYEVSIVGSVTPKTRTETPRTNTEKNRLDFQYKKESRAEERQKANAAASKRYSAQKAYDDYINSAEYGKKRAEREKQYQIDRAAAFAIDGFTPKMADDPKEMQLRAARDQAEAEYNAAEDQKVVEQDLEAITGLSNAERQQLEQYAVNQIRDQNLPIEMIGLMPTARQEASNFIDKYGQKRADEMAETFMRQENAKFAQDVDAKSREFADKHGVIGSAATIPVAAVSGLVGTVGQLQGMARNTGRYQTLDPNATGTIGDTFTGAVRGQVGQNISDLLGGGIAGQIGSGVYQGVMSAADSIARGFLGGGAFGGAALAATGSFSQTMADASRQGATPAQAALLATTTAGIEALSEKIPLDNLIRTAKGQGAKTVIANALRQMGIEATTEEISLLGTVLAEAAILQEKSTYQQDVLAAIGGGTTPEEAILQASKNVLSEALNTLLVSAVSGGVSSIGGSYADARGIPVPPTSDEIIEGAQSDIDRQQERITAATQAAQQPQTETQQVQETQQPQTAEQAPQQTAQPQPQQNGRQSLIDIYADMFTQMRENNGKATNKMANTAMNNPAVMQELGVSKEGSKADQRRRVKEEMENLFRKQNEETQIDQNIPIAEPMQATEASEQATTQASTPTTDMQMGANNQSAEGGQIQGTGAAEANFTGKAAYQDLLYEGNVQRDRPGDVRPVEVPKTDTQGKPVTEFAGNAYGSPATPDRMANEIENLIQSGDMSFDRRTNRQSLENAAAAISQNGEASVRRSITKNIDSGKVQDGDVEKAILLYTRYANRNSQSSQDNASELLVDLAAMANMTGRDLQLFKLLRRMTPEGQLMAVQKEIRRNAEKMIRAGSVKKGFEPVMNPELEQNYIQAAKDTKSAKSDQARQEAEQSMQELQNAMYLDAAAQMPATFKAKWDAWRYMAMLGNAKTQIRNLAGNLAFKPYKEVKDKMGALAEKLFVPKDQRTKSLVTDKALAKWARADAKNQSVSDALKYSAKLGDDVSTQKIRENMQVFNNKALDSVRKFVEGVTGAGDMLFKNNYYSRSLAGFLKARGYTAADVQNDLVNPEVMSEARSYAIQEAMKATFNDSNAFSDFLATGLRYNGDNPIGKALNIAAEGVLPFRRTPANIAVRFTEYSPVGVAKGLWNAATKVRKGEMTAATAIDQLTSGLTGSAVMALGFALAGGLNGIKITGSGTDEDEKRQGHQDYALEFSVDGQEYSYKIDWAAPANLPLFVGANIYSALENAGEDTDVSKFTSFIRGMGTMFEPLLALSCMSSLNDLVEGVRYAEEGEALYTIASQAATSYFTQGIPSLARQATQAFTENRQTTFTTSDDPTIRDLQSTAAGIGVGNVYKTDKVTAWGEKENQGNLFERSVNAFLNPGTLKRIDNSAVEQEINRLNDAGQNVSPDYFSKTVSYIDKDGNGHDEVRLTEEQYQTLAQTQGQTARKLLEDMFQSASYKGMTDEQKAEAIKTAYQYARMTGEIAAIGEEHTGYDQSWMYDVEKGGANEILRRELNSGINTAMGDLDNAWEKKYDEERFVQEMENMFRSYQNAPASMKKQVYAEAEGSAKKYIEVRDKGITHDDAIAALKQVATVKGTGAINKETGKPTIRDIDRRQAIAKAPNISDKAKDILIKAYMADFDPNAAKKEYTELKYNYIREYLGLSPEEYAEVYRAVLDEPSDKKDDDVVMALGYDRKTAKAIADVFNSTRSGKRAYINWYKKNM